MILHLVTNRHRLAPGASVVDARACLVDQARFAVEAGIEVLQVREQDLATRELCDLVRQIVAVARGSRTRVVVNDRLDVALATGADGVHLPARGLPTDRARTLAPPGFIIGRSVHTVGEAAGAVAADYLIAGTVWPTVSKPDQTSFLGVAGLAEIVEAVSVPVLAIGGVAPGRLGDVARTGAAGIAAIGLFTKESPNVPCRAAALASLTERLRAEFDTPRPGS